jgi:hypothetical protein
MKSLRHATFQITLLICCYTSALSSPDSGFFLPDSVNEMTLRYRTVRNLIVLPVVLNDSIAVNLILDTGCRNLILFGKRFQKLLKINPGREVQFSGLGSGEPVRGALSLGNKVSIHQVLGERIAVVVVPNKNVLGMYTNVHGVIGYEIFYKFEIELNPRAGTITFRPAARVEAPFGYAKVPLRIVDCRPVLSSEVTLNDDHHKQYDLMIDTGSSLGLLLKTTNMREFRQRTSIKTIGIGFNGPIEGYESVSDHLKLEGFDMKALPTGIIESPWHNYASIGMDVLKDYILVINYLKAYACFKKLEQV